MEIRVNQRERATFERAAERAGLDLSEWVRTELLRSAKRERAC
jgi:uncharacterized protein (DUF1778 family)